LFAHGRWFSPGTPASSITKAGRHDIAEIKEGIPLGYNNIKKNPGLRALAKLILNSFWGKFGQRSTMPRIKYISEPAE
jgi:hypothetical protein